MPPKHAHKPRAWGTRYDTLLSSPPTSPPRPIAQGVTSAPHSPITLHKVDDSSLASASTATSAPKSEKPRNDSSIFVGSLPSNAEPEELSRLLTQHLSEYAGIVSIKAVADKKGGMCAFIQCLDDEAAASLLDTLQTTQQRPFMGRTLRYELARSFRTLLISYRAPNPHTYPSSGFDRDESENTILPLAKAMRIVRYSSGRPLVLWDTTALEYDAATQESSPNRLQDRVLVTNILFSPLIYNAETLCEISAAFGPLDHFGLFSPKSDAAASTQDGLNKLNIHSHSPSRASEIEEGMWEVKWENRDDCATAYQVLKRVPHLAVCWAHHQFPSSGYDSRYGSPATSPNPHSTSYTRFPRQSRSCIPPTREYQHYGDVRPAIPSHSFSPSSLRLSTSFSTGDITSPTPRNWAPTYSSPQLHDSPLAPGHEMSNLTTEATLTPEWSEVDFPPLGDKDWASDCFHAGKSGLILPWTRREDEPESSVAATSPSPSSSLSVQPATPISAITLKEFSDESEGAAVDKGAEHGEELTMPPTPDFSISSMTPVTRRTSLSLPQTPQSTANTTLVNADITKSPKLPVQTTPKKGRFGTRVDTNTGRDVPAFDATTVWIGGLDTGRWNAARVETVFGQYGSVAEVDFHAREILSFAFVKFNESGASAKAVSEENDRLYDGRPIRVQFKQLNPPARGSPMRFSRGRGRMRSYGAHRLQSDYADFGSDGYASDRSPRRPTSQDPFCMPTRSPASASRLSANFSENSQAASNNSTYGTVPVVKRSSNVAAASPSSQASIPRSHGPAHTHTTRPFAFDVTNTPGVRDRPVSVSSTSSPPPSSASQSSTMSASVSGLHVAMPPYGYYPPLPWAPYPYGYGMPPYMGPYYAPMPPPPRQQQQGTGNAASESEQNGVPQTMLPTWPAVNHQLKASPTYQLTVPAPPQSDAAAQQPTPPQPDTQPPLHPTGFYHTDHGALVPLYHPDALLNYQLARGDPQASPPPISQPHTQTQPPVQPTHPQSQTQPQTHAPAPPQWYPPMAPYPYPYAHMPVPSGQTSAGAPSPMPYAMGGWASAPPTFPVQRPQGQAHPSGTPPPYIAPSASSGSMNTSASFTTPYPSVPPYQHQNAHQSPHQHQQQGETIGPRHALMNRRYQRGNAPAHGNGQHGYQNNHQGQGQHRSASQRYGGRSGYAPAPMLEPSTSYVDPAMQRHQQQHQQSAQPLRMSGSFPAHLSSGPGGGM